MSKVRVVGYKVLINPNYPLPILRCKLENGEYFDMSSIPIDAAIAIERLANGVDITTDPRMILALVLAEIPAIESVLRSSIEEVVIDDVIKHGVGYVYCASVKININGRSVRKVMVPSSAIVLALLAGADVYVDEKVMMSRE